MSLSLSNWYPGSGVVLDCIDFGSVHPYLLYSERITLVVRIRFIHISSRIHQNCDRIFLFFDPNVYALAFLRICSYAPGAGHIPNITVGSFNDIGGRYTMILQVTWYSKFVDLTTFAKFR